MTTKPSFQYRRPVTTKRSSHYRSFYVRLRRRFNRWPTNFDPLPLVAGLKRSNAELTYLGAVDFVAAAIVFYCAKYA